jgi:hypothetical protein
LIYILLFAEFPEPSPQRVHRVIRMTPVKTANTDGKITRSILLPVSSLKGGAGLRTIRIINTSQGGGMPAGLRVVCSKPQSPTAVQTPTLSTTSEVHSEAPSDTGSEDSDGIHYPRLDLTSK